MDTKLTIAGLLLILAGVIFGLALPLLMIEPEWLVLLAGPVTIFAQIWLVITVAFAIALAMIVGAVVLHAQWHDAMNLYAEPISKDELLRLTQRDDPRTDSLKRRQTIDRRGE